MNQATMTLDPTTDPYWSRTTDEWEIVERQDPVVWDTKRAAAALPPALSPQQLEDYEREGYHFAPALFSDQEATRLLAEVRGLAAAARPGTPGVVIEPGERAVRSLFRLHRSNALIRQVCQDPRLVSVARQVLGGDVYVHQSRVNFKPAFDGKEFFWHSDFETWHLEDGMPRMRAVSVSINLTENTEFNGPLMVVPKSHLHYVRCAGATPEKHYEKSLRQQEYGVPSREAMEQLVNGGGIQAPKGPAGSALFFECNLMHGSSGNLSPFPRTNLFIVYNSIENAVTDPFNGLPARPDYLAERTVTPVQELPPC
jgi:ectoine hydroxylase